MIPIKGLKYRVVAWSGRFQKKDEGFKSNFQVQCCFCFQMSLFLFSMQTLFWKCQRCKMMSCWFLCLRVIDLAPACVCVWIISDCTYKQTSMSWFQEVSVVQLIASQEKISGFLPHVRAGGLDSWTLLGGISKDIWGSCCRRKMSPTQTPRKCQPWRDQKLPLGVDWFVNTWFGNWSFFA